MSARRIPQRELRNNIGAVLREAEAGVEFTITVHGRAVASLGPPRTVSREVDVDLRRVAELLSGQADDPRFPMDLETLRGGEAPLDDPWERP
jgi:prevent-host-death family protein